MSGLASPVSALRRESPVFSLRCEWVFRIEVVCAAEQALGNSPEGLRLNYPIVRGTVEGPRLRGTVRPGEDWYLSRRDGLGAPDARYGLMSDDGVLINVANRALLQFVPGVVESDIAWPPAPDQYRCHCTPSFQAPAGPYEWLNQAVFVGAIRYESEDGVTIDVYRLI